MTQSDTNDTPKKDDERDARRRARFVKALTECANVSQACIKAGISRSMVYRRREADADFAKAWDEALDEAVDSLEQEAWRRARDGVTKPVYQMGKEVGAIQEYSDTLMIFLLKSNRPAKYRETTRHEHTGANGGAIEVKAVDYRDGLAALAPGPTPDSDAPS